uniref:Yippee domain-containing protein n=1 Tax=Mycena chlorophos TaxID=658473 RepID=A0ABQ0M926_MYCCL|nr:predicted protein [Mycena chlorophos]
MSGAPCIWTIHFPAAAFSWTTPEALLDGYVTEGKPYKTRYRCKTCGACVASHNVKTESWSIWGAQLERDERAGIKGFDAVKPTAHIFFETAVIGTRLFCNVDRWNDGRWCVHWHATVSRRAEFTWQQGRDFGLGNAMKRQSIFSSLSPLTMEVDPHKVDEDAPQISTLPSETPPPVQRRVKLLVNRPPSVASQPSSVASTSRKRPISALSDEDDEQIDELIDDDAPMPTAPVRHPASVPIPAASSEPPAKKKAPAKRKPRKTEKKQAEEERIAAERVMQQQHTTGGPPPSMTWFEVSPNKGQPGQQQQPQQQLQLQQLQQQGAGGQMGTIDLSVKELKIVPLDPGPSAAPPQKKEKAPRKTPAATRGRAKPGPKPKQALLLPIPASDDMLEVASEAGFSVTAASSPITTHFDANTPEPEAVPVPANGNGNGTIAEEPMTINLQDIPLPQYPLPLKPFSVQPPAKISSSGSAQPAPLDRSGAKVRQWRVVNREIRGIAGGRWVTKTWIGAKESAYAQVLEKQAAAVALPKVPSIPTGGTSNKPGPKPKAKNANAAASSSKAPSAVPSRSSSAVPTKMRTVVAAPSSDAGDSVAESVSVAV